MEANRQLVAELIRRDHDSHCEARRLVGGRHRKDRPTRNKRESCLGGSQAPAILRAPALPASTISFPTPLRAHRVAVLLPIDRSHAHDWPADAPVRGRQQRRVLARVTPQRCATVGSEGGASRLLMGQQPEKAKAAPSWLVANRCQRRGRLVFAVGDERLPAIPAQNSRRGGRAGEGRAGSQSA